MKKGTKKGVGFIEKFSKLHSYYCDSIVRNGYIEKTTDSISDFLDWLKSIKNDPTYGKRGGVKEFWDL